MSAIATVNPDLTIALSHELAEAFNLAPGQTLLVERRGDVLEFRQRPRTAHDLVGVLSKYAPDVPVSVDEMNEAVIAEAVAQHAKEERRR